MAAVIPEKVEVNGEQISGDGATVFVKIADADKAAEAEPVGLIRDGGTSFLVGLMFGDVTGSGAILMAGRAVLSVRDYR